MEHKGEWDFPRSRREGEKVSGWESGKRRREGHEQEKRNRCPSDTPLLSSDDRLLDRGQAMVMCFCGGASVASRQLV